MTHSMHPYSAGQSVPTALDARRLVRHLARSGTCGLELDGATWEGAALAVIAERWRAALSSAGVTDGDRVVITLPGGPAFIGALLGAFTLGATVALAPPDVDGEHLLESLDARLVIRAAASGPGAMGARLDGAPMLDGTVARAARSAPTQDAMLLLRTSGSAGDPRWIALSETNVGAVLLSHAHALPPAGSIVASVLPWHHVFGLVLELLPALLRGALMLRDPASGRDPAALLRTARGRGVTHLSAVPATVSRLVSAPGGMDLLAALHGGTIGGAPVEAPLAAALAETRLRVGYGLTEASPGVALGLPGEWRARALGRAVGCEVRIDADGVLAFRGANAALGEWSNGALHRHDPSAWRRTGDVVRDDDGALWFEGRASAAFKLANGRWVEAWRVEAALHASVPGLRDVLLAPADGEGLTLLHTRGDEVSIAQLRAALGSLASLPHECRPVAPDAWPRTRKGEVDRAAAQRLARPA